AQRPDGAPIAMLGLAPTLGAALRLDVAFDDAPHVLGRLGAPNGPWGVVRLAPDGSVTHSFALATAGRPADVAVAPDGRIYVSMSTVTGGLDQIDIYDVDGVLLGSIKPAEMGPQGLDQRFTYELFKLDIASDGTVYVIALAWRECPPDGPNPPRTPPPPPTPTPRPSLFGFEDDLGGAALDGALDASDQDDDFPCEKEIVLVFEPDNTFREEIPNPHTADIAVGPSGVFVSTDEPFRRTGQRIYELGADEATFSYRTPRRLDIPASISAAHMQLDVAADGRLHAVTNLGAPFYRGALTFGHPDRSTGPGTGPESPLGLYESPMLAGPHNPRRIDAADVVMLVEEPYQRTASGEPPSTTVDMSHDTSAVQRWSLAGVQTGQYAHHTDVLRDGAEGSSETRTIAPVVDVAYDGQELYMLSPQFVWHRPDELPPDWYRRTAGSHFLALSADTGRVAVLNGAVGRIMVLDSRGNVLYDRPLDNDMSGRLAGDLALSGDVLYVTDQGRNRVIVRGIDGSDLGDWPTDDGPERISVSNEGNVFVLGRGGTGLRYTPDGQLIAAWTMPLDHNGVPVEAQDLAVGDDGRVYVSFVGLSQTDLDDGDRRISYDADAGGVWVFEPVERPEGPPDIPTGDKCFARPDKYSDPPIILLGETVDLTLTVDGQCPGELQPHQLMIVLDTSWSMHDNYFLDQPGLGALSRAKELLGATLAALDPSVVELGLVTFSGGAGIDVPLPGELALVRQRVLSRIADGDTRMGVGIDLARQQLDGPAGNPNAKQTILIVTDGVFKDDPAPAIAAAAADGIDIVTVVLTTPEFDAAARARLEAVLGPGAALFIDPMPQAAGDVFDAVSSYLPNPGLFESITIDDVLPDDMEYESGSASPPAGFDAASNTLTWDLGRVLAAEPITLRYRVTPRRTGNRDTNVRAGATYVDALGNPGELVFPVPDVLVLAPDPLPTFTPTASPTPTATPRPGKIYLPYAVKERFCRDKVIHTDVALILDMSTSMYRLTSAGRTKHEAELAAAKAFVDQLQVVADDFGGLDQVAVVGFNDRAWTAAELTSDRDVLDGALDGLLDEIREGTRLDLAFAEGRRVLSGPNRLADNTPAIVLLTDGLPNRVPTPVPVGGQEDTVLAEAARAKEAGIQVYTIGLGESGDVLTWMLTEAASEPSMYYYAPDGEDLAEIYRRILKHLVCDDG
ncbi:MAG: VWA domain-containing protein, partial [Anaerolineae bacterium]